MNAFRFPALAAWCSSRRCSCRRPPSRRRIATKIANSVVAALQAKGGAKASFDPASANGDDVVITNFKVSREGSDATVPSVVIASPVERTPGGFTAASISFDNGKIVDGEQTISWKTGISKDAVVPDPTEVHSTAKITPSRISRSTGSRWLRPTRPIR